MTRTSASSDKRLQQLARLGEANALLEVIARYGRRFFYSQEHERVSRFDLDARGRVWFVDDYTGRRIYTHYEGDWRGFTHGGTLRGLCIALRDYIRTAKAISPRWLGPWPADYCGGDLWGYGSDMEHVRCEARTCAAIAWPPTAIAGQQEGGR